MRAAGSERAGCEKQPPPPVVTEVRSGGGLHGRLPAALWYPPFQVCGKSFNRMYNLLGHMHLHAGSKPFKCPYCSSKFNLKGNLSRHMKVKHGVMDISLDSQGGWAVRSGQSGVDSSMAHSGGSSAVRGAGRLAKAETAMRWAQVWREGEPGEPSWQ